MRRLERMTTVEGASQEYLKNVVLNYMLSTDMGSKNHMLKAIGAVLRLTDKEVKSDWCFTLGTLMLRYDG